MKSAVLKILLTLATVLAPALAPATTFLHSKSQGIELDTVYDDDVYISGFKIKFDSKVHGDLFDFCYEMVQTDTIDGNFMSFAYSVENLAPVTGSMRIFAGNASCNSQIGKNLLMFCQNANLAPTASIGRDADIFGQNVSVQGSIGRNLKVKAHNATISGTIYGDVNFVGDSLTINPNTTIAGNLNYKSASRATIGDGVKIGGEINWKRAELEKKPGKKHTVFPTALPWIFSFGSYLLSTIIFYIFVFVVFVLPVSGWLKMISLWFILGVSGNLIILLTRQKALATELTLKNRFLPSLGLGFILLFLLPIVAIIVFCTIIGAPLAMILMMLFGIALLIGGVYVCLFIGRQICGFFRPGSANTPGYLCYTIGMIILMALSFIPILGYLITLVVMMLSLGGLGLTYWNSRLVPRPPEPPKAD